MFSKKEGLTIGLPGGNKWKQENTNTIFPDILETSIERQKFILDLDYAADIVINHRRVNINKSVKGTAEAKLKKEVVKAQIVDYTCRQLSDADRERCCVGSEIPQVERKRKGKKKVGRTLAQRKQALAGMLNLFRDLKKDSPHLKQFKQFDDLLVSLKEANNRMIGVCRKCPMRIEDPKWSTFEKLENAAIEKILSFSGRWEYAKSSGKMFFPKGAACSFCSCSIPAMVHFKKDVFKEHLSKQNVKGDYTNDKGLILDKNCWKI